MRYALLILALALTPIYAYAVEEVPPTPAAKMALFDDVTSNLACLCGCGTTIKTCPHDDCPFAVPIRAQVREMIDSGKGEKQIYDTLVATVKYDGTRLGRGPNVGQAILASPTFSGFNIMAWVTPFIAILAVGFLVLKILKNWSGRKKAAAEGPAEEAAAPTPRADDPYLEKMKKELEDFED